MSPWVGTLSGADSQTGRPPSMNKVTLDESSAATSRLAVTPGYAPRRHPTRISRDGTDFPAISTRAVETNTTLLLCELQLAAERMAARLKAAASLILILHLFQRRTIRRKSAWFRRLPGPRQELKSSLLPPLHDVVERSGRTGLATRSNSSGGMARSKFARRVRTTRQEACDSGYTRSSAPP